MNQKLMVVVRYDLYPYMLCYDVERIEPNGEVTAKDVGTYKRSGVIAIVPKDEGMKIRARIAAIGQSASRAHKEACDKGLELIRTEFPVLRKAS